MFLFKLWPGRLLLEDPNPDDTPVATGDDPSDPEGDEPTEPTLEQKRAALLKKGEGDEPSGDEPSGDEPSGDDDEVLDWDALMEEHPEIAKLGIKTVEELASRYSGGLGDFQKNQELNKTLEGAGFDTPEKRKELLLTLQSGKVKPSDTPRAEDTKPKSFVETRREGLARFIPKEVIDSETEEPRALTGEEKETQIKRSEEFADTIMPSHIPDTVDRVQQEATDLQDDLAWAVFQLRPILELFKDIVPPNSRRDEIREHSKEFPQIYAGIIQGALKKGQNFYGPANHYFTSNTKKDEVDAAKAKKKQEDAEKEAQRRKDAAGSAGAHKSGKSVKTSTDKPFATGSLGDKKAKLLKRVGERVQ